MGDFNLWCNPVQDNAGYNQQGRYNFSLRWMESSNAIGSINADFFNKKTL